MAGVDEFSGEDAAIVHVVVVTKLLFVYHRKFIAGLNIQSEVDIPTEDVVRHLHDQIGAHAGFAR